MNQLAILEGLKPAEIYSPEKVDFILNKISEEARGFKPDISTSGGRKEIASLAYKIAQSKTFMDECGKKLGEEAKKTLDTINAERKKIRESLDALKEDIRKPLTDWEVADEKRKKAHKNHLIEIEEIGLKIANGWMTSSIDLIKSAAEIINRATLIDWEDFREDADKIIPLALSRVTSGLEAKQLHDDQQAELQKLRAEKEEREKLEAEQLEIKKNQEWIAAQNKLKKEAEEKEFKERAEREKKMALEKEAAIKFEREAADRRVKESEDRAQRDKEAAVEKERQRVLNEKLKLEAEEQKRQSNIKHRAKINNEILKALNSQGLDDETGKKVITAIVSGIIPHTKVNY